MLNDELVCSTGFNTAKQWTSH